MCMRLCTYLILGFLICQNHSRYGHYAFSARADVSLCEHFDCLHVTYRHIICPTRKCTINGIKLPEAYVIKKSSVQFPGSEMSVPWMHFRCHTSTFPIINLYIQRSRVFTVGCFEDDPILIVVSFRLDARVRCRLLQHPGALC